MQVNRRNNKGPFSLILSYPSRKYIPELDGVRGLAILLVIFYHCFPGALTGIGWIGVDLFFVLSGFLITGILIDTKGGSRYYLNFIGRRILRIFPLYYAVLLVLFIVIPLALVISHHNTFPHDFYYYLDHQGWFWSYLQNWLYSITGFPENHLLVHFWSLGVEEQFYLVWPLIILFVPERYLLKVSLFLCGISIIFRLLPLDWFGFSSTYRYMATVSRMDALLIGAMIAQLIRKDIKILQKLAIPLGILGLIIFVLGAIVVGSQSFMHLAEFYTAIDLFMGMVLLLSFSKVLWFKKVMRFPILKFFGKYSYGLYVYHYIIYVLLKYITYNFSIFKFNNYFQWMMITGIATIILAIGVSLLSYHFFEVRFLKLKSYFRNTPKKMGKPPLTERVSASY